MNPNSSDTIEDRVPGLAGSAVPFRRARACAESALRCGHERAEGHPALVADDDGALPCITASGRCRPSDSRSAGRRMRLLLCQEGFVSCLRIPGSDERQRSCVAAACVLDDDLAGVCGDESHATEPVGLLVGGGRQAMCFVRVEAEVGEGLTAFVADKTLCRLQQHAVLAVAVRVPDFHDAYRSDGLPVALRARRRCQA